MNDENGSRTMSGFHHVTAIAGDAQRNLDFYAGVLGQRLVKRTINFDAPSVYHFYYADNTGTPGTVLTFFPYANARKSVRGVGEIGAVAYRVPAGSLPAWRERFAAHDIAIESEELRFGARVLAVLDPDGMRVELVEMADAPAVEAWPGSTVPAAIALRGFHSTTHMVREEEASAVVLRELFGWQHVGREENRSRWQSADDALGRTIDFIELPDAPYRVEGAGSVHHVAFRTPDDEGLVAWQSLLRDERFEVTDVRDRSYFHSIYFREPNGILYEIATDAPGFTLDEPVEALGSALRLPAWLEEKRASVAAGLPAITVPA